MYEVPFKANNNREAVVVCARHVMKRPSKRSVLVLIVYQTETARIVSLKYHKNQIMTAIIHFLNLESSYSWDVFVESYNIISS